MIELVRTWYKLHALSHLQLIRKTNNSQKKIHLKVPFPLYCVYLLVIFHHHRLFEYHLPLAIRHICRLVTTGVVVWWLVWLGQLLGTHLMVLQLILKEGKNYFTSEYTALALIFSNTVIHSLNFFEDSMSLPYHNIQYIRIWYTLKWLNTLQIGGILSLRYYYYFLKNTVL